MIVFSQQREPLDAMIHRHYGWVDAALLQAVLQANPQLAASLVDGRVADYQAVNMPDIAPVPSVKLVQLWQ